MIYQIKISDPDDDGEDAGLFVSLAAAREFVLEIVRLELYADSLEALGSQSWDENGASEESPTYECEYRVGETVYTIRPRSVSL